MKKLTFTIFATALLLQAFAQKDFTQQANDLLAKMTLEEKIGQMTLYTSGWDVTGPTLRESYKEDIRSGKCGNIFNAHTAKYNRELQR
ncbi:MAG: hypothetical protein R2825_31170, partial [Saprospiraceae bacterium]